MTRRLPLLAALIAATLASAATAEAKPEDAVVGDVRAVFANRGTPLLGEPKSLTSPLEVLPRGARLRIVEVRYPWFRVQALSGQQRTGWVKAVQTVAPFALTGQRRLGLTGADNRPVTRVARPVETSAAYRPGEPGDVKDGVERASPATMRRGYALLATLEAKSVEAPAIERFAGDGKLGNREPAAPSVPAGP